MVANNRQLDDPIEPTVVASPLRTRVIPAVTIGLVVALLALLGYSLFSPNQSELGAGGRVNTSGSLIPLGNREAPNFTLTSFDGSPLSLEEFRGKTVILNFWASWCGPCEEEAPLFAELARTVDPTRVAVVGVAVMDNETDARNFVDRFALTYPNAPDHEDGSVGIDYGVAGVPETFFIDPEGRMLGKYPGAITSQEQMDALMRELNLVG